MTEQATPHAETPSETGAPVPGFTGGQAPGQAGPGSSALVRPEPSNLADILERVLDKGVVIAGDIRVDLVGIELLTIRLRLLVASVDRAREMGIDWWTQDPMLSSHTEDSDRRRQHREGHRPRHRRSTPPETTDHAETADHAEAADSGDAPGADDTHGDRS